MKNIDGIWLPDSEEHMIQWIKEQGGYQMMKQTVAYNIPIQRRTAIDIGAHCGTWALNMVKHFRTVHCFEPIPEHLECLRLNAPMAEIYPYALGEKGEKVAFYKGSDSTGDTHIDPNTRGDVDTKTLDSFNIQEVDFIKIDCEGYEFPIIKGGLETILRWKPTMVVEQKPLKASKFGYKDTEAVDFLKSHGAKLVQTISGDYFFTW